MQKPGKATDAVLTPAEVCELYPIFRNPQALADLRYRGDGPDYIKTAGRAGRVYYRQSAVERYLDDRTVKAGGQRAA
ncbi:DNA-binding protein [Streptomyces goshikiensis]|uniref:DNA-binding protein n=1 Tax=Streptomyces goshikiensis TaxID=1942 RepID=UPI0037133841